MSNHLHPISLSNWRTQGKVRDTYAVDDKLVIVTTDRQSAFDRLLAAIPFKVAPCGGQSFIYLLL